MTIFFSIVALLSLLCALGVVLVKNPIYCGLFLITKIFLFGILYIGLYQEFIAVIQVLVYAGAIMVLFLFIIMLLGIPSPNEIVHIKKGFIIGAILCIALIVKFITVLLTWVPSTQKGSYTQELITQKGATQLFADEFFTNYILPFEFTALLFLLVTIGVLVLTKNKYLPKK